MILMIRDPRAIASSLQKRKISIGSVDNQGGFQKAEIGTNLTFLSKIKT